MSERPSRPSRTALTRAMAAIRAALARLTGLRPAEGQRTRVVFRHFL